jgi:hypothetical protein
MAVDVLTLRIEQEHQIAKAREAVATAIESLRVTVTIAKAIDEAEGFTQLDDTHSMSQSLGGAIVTAQRSLAEVMHKEREERMQAARASDEEGGSR